MNTRNERTRPRYAAIAPMIALIVMITFIVIGTLVVLSTTRQRAHLHDGTVWVSSSKDRTAIRFNVRAATTDSHIAATSATFDVIQHDDDMLLIEPNEITRVDAATVSASDTVSTADDVHIAMASGTVAILDRSNGIVRIGPVQDLHALNMAAEPTMKLGDGGRIAMAHDGTVYGYRPSDGMVMTADRSGSSSQIASLSEGERLEIDDFTVVGVTPVAVSDGIIRWPGGKADTQLKDRLTLQAPDTYGEQGSWVVAAHSGGAVVTELRSGERLPVMLSTGGTGEPAIPVPVAGCVYAAWSQSARNYRRICSSDGADSDGSADRIRTLRNVTSTSHLVFRTNHRLILLNDDLQGLVWEPQISSDTIDVQWEPASDGGDDTGGTTQTIARKHRERSDECSDGPAAFRAMDDDMGVRVGTARVLDVLGNDEQTDCSILAVTAVREVSGSDAATRVRIWPVYSGRYIRLDASSAKDHDAGEIIRFSYDADNGQGQVSSANVTVTLVGEDGNRAPVHDDPPKNIDVERGGIWRGNILDGFHDPDGDPMMLLSASVTETTADTAEPVTVSVRSDGLLELMAHADAHGRVRMAIIVSDGAETCAATAYVSIREPDTLPALIDPVARSAEPGTTTVIDLAQHIHETSTRTARLSAIDDVPGATVDKGTNGLSFTFVSHTPGTYYVPYTIMQGHVSATGRARIDVRIPDQNAALPIIADDAAVLDDNGAAIAEPLANDVDPSGGILGLSQVDVDSGSGITAGISGSRMYLQADRLPDMPVTIRYAASNGNGTSWGHIVIYPPSMQRTGMLTADDITLQVRAGGMVSTDVMAHVRRSSATTVYLDRTVNYDSTSFRGLLINSGNTIRYQASDQIGRFEATYTVRDQYGNASAGTIIINVHAADAKGKAEPEPKAVQAQVQAGRSVHITIPMTGIDEDGDDVILLGLGNTAPSLGRIVDVGASHMVYEAYADSNGTDSFSYAMEDWAGNRAQAKIRVSILQSDTTTGVMARDDESRLRPGMQAVIRVIANDIASYDDVLRVDAIIDTHHVSDAVIDDSDPGSISFTAPDQPGLAHIVYRVSNQAGLSDTATLTVHVDEQAPIDPPTAEDYRVPPADTIDKRSVDIDVTPWIANPSGSRHELSVEVHASARDHARKRGGRSSRIIVIDLADEALSIPYTVTNLTHGISTTAFIHVPAYGVFPPTLRPKAPTLTVHAGQSLTIRIDDHVRVGAGKSPYVVSPDMARSTQSTDDTPIVDAQTLRFTARDDYAGPASITFMASDVHPEDQQHRIINTAMLTLPITVVGSQPPKPMFSSPTVDIAAGESTTIDLRSLTRIGNRSGSDSNDSASANELTYTTPGCPSHGLTVSVTTSGTMSIDVPNDAVPGTTCTAAITIRYQHGGTIAGNVTIRVTASARPLARVSNADVVIRAGSTERLNMLKDAYNPFEDVPLSVVSCSVEAPHSITVEHCSGTDGITVSAASDSGSASGRIRVRIRDATGHPDRWTTAMVTVTVIDRPTAPIPMPIDPRPRNATIDISWTPGKANGSPIAEYQVQWDGGSLSCGISTNCTITNLVNGRRYSFTVRARNEVGWSDDSIAVNGTPDAVPTAPNDITVESGYRSVTVRWSKPLYTGSDPDLYTVTLSDSAGHVRSTQTSTTTDSTFTVPADAIRDGSTFQAKVTARNRAGTGAEGTSSTIARPWSDPDHPALTLRQEGNAIIVQVTLGDMRNAGCARVSITGALSATLPCDAPTASLALDDAENGSQTDSAASYERLHGKESHEPLNIGRHLIMHDISAPAEEETASPLTFTATVHTRQSPAQTPSVSATIVPKSPSLPEEISLSSQHPSHKSQGATMRHTTYRGMNGVSGHSVESIDDSTWISQDATRLRSGIVHQLQDTPATAGSATAFPPSDVVGVASPSHSAEATSTPAQSVQQLREGFEMLCASIGKVIIGKPLPIRLCVTALLAGGHVLIEDDPGTGKTQLAKGLARSIDVSFNRIQFTADLLPSDIVGSMIYNRKCSEFEFRPGPVFASVILADEINRASPKTQSALLEVMDEQQVTVEGAVHDVPRPFMVIATQNPVDQLGTYRLPEAQMDRFLIRTSIHHPGHEASLDLARSVDLPDRSASASPVLDAEQILFLRTLAGSVHIDESVLDYIVRIVEAIRHRDEVSAGPSTRGMLALVRCVRIWAASAGRDYVIPDDVKDLSSAVLAHRLVLGTEALMAGRTAHSIVISALDEVPVPILDEYILDE